MCHGRAVTFSHARHAAAEGKAASDCATCHQENCGVLYGSPGHPECWQCHDVNMLALVGGLFVIEALSVIFQVSFFKMTSGKRIFRMAPLHHHFELKGWPEPKVIVRFWIIAIALALLAMSTLKLR